MIDIKIAQKGWGGCSICLDFKKIDILPRVTISDLIGCLYINIGFLMLTFTLCIYDYNMRKFVKELENREKNDTDGAGDSQDS